MSFGEYEAAARMRRLILEVAEGVVNRLRPAPRYGRVTAISSTYTMVRLNGDPDPISVNNGSIRPYEVGQLVRVTGIGADRYIDDVLTGPALFQGTDLVALADYLGTIGADVSAIKSPTYDTLALSGGWKAATGRALPKAATVHGKVIWEQGRVAVANAFSATGGGNHLVGIIGTRGRPLAGSSWISVVVSSVNRVDPAFVQTDGAVYWRPPTTTSMAVDAYLAVVDSSYPLSE